MRLTSLLILICLIAPAFANAHSNEVSAPTDSTHNTPAAEPGRVELLEHLGEKLPLDLQLTDSTGAAVHLEQLIDRPTLIVPVFYECRNVCNFLLGGLAKVLPDLKLDAGEDYQVITFSIDPSETSEQAAHSKKTFINAIGAPFPKEAWHFLTGAQEEIHALTDAAGYYYKKQGDDFLHPIVAFVVTGEGKIVRYLTGQRFVPLDLSMALFEASEDRIGTPIRKALEFCFSYDPQGRKYVFNLLRVSGTVILLTLGSFLTYLILSGRKKKP